MGVKKLHTFLSHNQAAIADEISIPPATRSPSNNNTILVDGYGFLITVAEHTISQNTNNFADEDISGGALPPIVTALENIVNNLRRGYGLELVLAVDAPRGLRDVTCARDEVWDSRAKESRELLYQQIDYCRGASPFKVPPKKGRSRTALPIMLFHQLHQTLRRLNVQVILLDDEVDSYIGSLVHEHNPIFVLTGDTDFVVTPGIPVVLHDHFPFENLADENCTMDSPLVFGVFTNTRLAAHLQLTEEELLIAASVAGNDITGDGLITGIKDAAVAVIAQRNGEGGGGGRNTKRKKKKKNKSVDAESSEEDSNHTTSAKNNQNNNKPAALFVNMPLIQASIKNYLAGARRIPFTLTLRTPELCAQFNEYVSHHIPLGLMGQLRVEDAVPLLHGEFGFVRDLPTYRRVRHAALFMVGRNTELVLERGTGDAHPVPKNTPIELSDTVCKALPQWTPTPPSSSFMGMKALEALFSMPSGSAQDLLLQEGKDGAMLLVMWEIHSGLEGVVELQRITEMLVIVRAAVEDHNDVAMRVLSSLPFDAEEGAVCGKRPQLRTLEMAHLLSIAVSDVDVLLRLLHLEKAIPSSEPQALFSAALLHTLNYICPNTPLTSGALVEHIGGTRGQYSPLLGKISDLMAVFYKMFPVPEFRGVSEAVVRQVDVVRCSWVGLLQRDEVLDFIEGGSGGGGKSNKADVTKKSVAASYSAMTPTAVHGHLGASEQARGVVAAASSSSAATPGADPASDALPIEAHMNDILMNIKDNRVVCLQGDTGCGKSSMIPLHVYLDAMKKNKEVSIIVTQPRRLAAVALASRVASLLGEEVGKTVGYRMGGNTRKESAATKIFFVTSGYLTQCLVHGGNLWGRTTHIILDEVHERSLEADMLSLVLRLMLQHDDATSRRPPGPSNSKRLVVMSATIQSELFMKYFSPLCWGGEMPPLMRVGGHRRHVVEMFLPDVLSLLQNDLPRETMADMSKYLSRVSKSMKGISLQANDIRALCHVILACVKRGTCILVFLPGLKEIEDAFEELSARRTHSSVDLRVHALHSIVDPEEQQQVLTPSTNRECKIVLSTNIAETSITIPDVKVVIDLGFSRRVEYDQTKGLRCIVCGWCSKAAARQRAGRAGRVTDGIVLRMYPEEVMTEIMPDFDGADFYPLESSVLQVREGLGAYGDVDDLMQQLVEPPPPQQVTLALQRLVEWGALGPAPEYEILALGRLASALPIDVSLTKAITSAAKFGCATDMAVIACGLMQQRPLFRRPMRTFYASDFEFQQNVAAAWKGICHFDRHRSSDVHTFLTVTEERCENSSHDFCEKWSLSYKQAGSFMQTAKMLCRRLEDAQKRGLMVLTPQDVTNMSIIAQGRGSIRFPSLHQESSDELLQIVLGQSSDRMLVGTVAANSAFRQALMSMGTSKAAAASSTSTSSTAHIISFEDVSQEITKLPIDIIKAKFAAFGSVRSCILSSEEGKKKSPTRLIIEMNPAAHEADEIPYNPSSPSQHSLSLPCSIAAICRFARLHSSRKTTLACANMEMGIPFPTPATAAKAGGWKVVPRGQDTTASVQMERWSVIGGHARDQARSTFGFAFGVMSGGSQLFATNTFLLNDLPGLPLLSLLCAGEAASIYSGFNPQKCRFEPLVKNETSGAWSAPLSTILMANVIRILQGPLCKSMETQTQLIDAYNKLRTITNALDKECGASTKADDIEPVAIMAVSMMFQEDDGGMLDDGFSSDSDNHRNPESPVTKKDAIFDVRFLKEYKSVLGGQLLWVEALEVYGTATAGVLPWNTLAGIWKNPHHTPKPAAIKPYQQPKAVKTLPAAKQLQAGTSKKVVGPKHGVTRHDAESDSDSLTPVVEEDSNAVQNPLDCDEGRKLVDEFARMRVVRPHTAGKKSPKAPKKTPKVKGDKQQQAEAAAPSFGGPSELKPKKKKRKPKEAWEGK